MEIDLTDAVETTADRVVLWQRMLDPSAVIGVLGGDAADVRALESPDSMQAEGHTFRIKGVGGGTYHARIERREEHSLLTYAVWSEAAPNVPLLLSYVIESSGPRTVLAGEFTMDMPLGEALASFSLPGVLALPLVGRLVRRYAARRLRAQLLSIAAPPPGKGGATGPAGGTKP